MYLFCKLIFEHGTVRFNFLGVWPILKSALNKLKLPQSKLLFLYFLMEKENNIHIWKVKEALKNILLFLILLSSELYQSTFFPCSRNHLKGSEYRRKWHCRVKFWKRIHIISSTRGATEKLKKECDLVITVLLHLSQDSTPSEVTAELIWKQ